MNHEPEGVSTRSLLGAFFAVVVLCAVFFSLGFFLGYRQGHPANAPVTEQVPEASDVPSEVNPPSSAASSTTSEPSAPARNQPPATQAAESETVPAQSTATAPSAPIEQEAKGSSPIDAGQSLDSVIAERVPPGLLVQVAAVTNQQDAANVAGVLKSKSYPALVLTPAQAKAKDSFYRVVAGPYKSRTDAERVRKELTAEGFKPFIR